MSLLKRSGLRSWVRWGSIIGALLVALSLGGCSAVRLGYSNAPHLAYWWLDRYFDFDSTQGDRLRAELDATLDWHRQQELPLLAQQFDRLQSEAARPVTAAQLCAVYASLRERAEAPLWHMAPTLAALAPSLQKTQLEHLAREYEKRNREWRDEWMDGPPTERLEQRVKQLVERAESFYGTLSETQRNAITAVIRQSGYDPAVQYRERLLRQQDTLQTLRGLVSNPPTALRAQAEIQALLERTLHSPDPAYRPYRDQQDAANCAALAALHNSATERQRAKLVDTLRAYADDARALGNPR
ncbi:MAG: DUF6279 family lipoprotein [Rhodoferax sp.]